MKLSIVDLIKIITDYHSGILEASIMFYMNTMNIY
jgi:hypothetical protein